MQTDRGSPGGPQMSTRQMWSILFLHLHLIIQSDIMFISAETWSDGHMSQTLQPSSAEVCVWCVMIIIHPAKTANTLKVHCFSLFWSSYAEYCWVVKLNKKFKFITSGKCDGYSWSLDGLNQGSSTRGLQRYCSGSIFVIIIDNFKRMWGSR